ncbi:hypothetical protein NL676_009725 [Syzygium grande]|nr:hypothetical protein NL676_009725 [Syzygium grande]
MERIQVLVKAVVSNDEEGGLGYDDVVLEQERFSMAEEVAKRLVIIGPEVLLFGVLKCFLGGTGRIGSVAIFILQIIINLRPWKKD